MGGGGGDAGGEGAGGVSVTGLGSHPKGGYPHRQPRLQESGITSGGDGMVDTIALEQVIVPSHQRELREWKIQHILEKIRERGYYNFSYPITIDEGNELVDGGHRLEAAKRAGLKEIPFIRKPQGIPSAQHAINCNQDGADTEPYDVFDYAYYCWMLAQQGWTGQMIAGELGEDWSRTKVQDYKAIKLRLCSDAWICARGVERKTEVSTSGRRSISHYLSKFRHNGTLLIFAPYSNI